MFELKVENKYGQILDFTNNGNYTISSIDGLEPPDGIINTTRSAGDDGSIYNSSYVDNRVITITLAINQPTEINRINLYKYFKTKYPVRVYYSNDTRNVFIDGYVQTMPIGFFDKKQIAQITIFCPKPYFRGIEDELINFSNVEALFEFPFEIEEPIPFSELSADQEKNIINYGDVETGALIVMKARGALLNPSFYNVETNQYFSLNISLEQGDEIQINTIKKEKSVYLISNGVKTNIVGNIKNGSTWFQFKPGDNLFITTADSSPENLETYVVISDQFEGV